MKQPNRVKAAMRAERKAYGYNLSFPSPWVIDILGKLDFDFIFIDGEHGPFGLDQLEDLCRTAERHNVTTIARVPDIGSSTILRYLDRGIMGILGPHIATEADARQLVRACYFGPLGERSFGANRGTDYNAGIADKAAYYREANEQMLVCALLEDAAVLDNLDTILSVPGIDLYSIGPNDFAQSLGYPGQPDHPEVVKTMQEITSHPTGRAHDATGRDARGVGQRYAARCGSSYSIIVAWVNGAVRSDIACKHAGTEACGLSRTARARRPRTWNRQKPFLTPSAMPNKSKRPGSGRYTDMMDDLKDTTATEAVAEDWAKVKLPPRLTGLPMAVWITENDGYPHDVRVKVSTRRGGRGSWRTAPSIAVRPQPHEIVPGSLPAADVALVSRWIDLNRDVIIDYWNGMIDFDEVKPRLQQVQP